MAHARTFRFGIQLASAPDGATWRELARRAEDLGYSTLFLPDHFGDQLAPIPAMMAAADATTELNVGCLVHDNDYKHPVVLAKELATIDLLSGGRVEVGLGAGWMRSDYDQSGIPYDEPKVRVARFEEGLQIMKALFADGQVDFAGEHYTIAGLDGRPKPARRPPLLVGGGKRRMLTFAGREADIVGVNPTIPNGAIDAEAARSGLAEATDEKLSWIKEGAGDRYADLEINLLNFACIVTDDRASVHETMAPLFSMSPAELAELPHALIGTVDEIADDLEARRQRWDASYVVVQQDALDAFAPVVARLAGT